MPSLFDTCEDASEDVKGHLRRNSNPSTSFSELKVNANFAKRYESYREKEEYSKLKARFGDEDDEDSSSSEEEVPPDAIDDSEFLKVLTAIRRKDPQIYDKNVKFFNQSNGEDAPPSKKTKKKDKHVEAPLRLDEYQRKVLLEQREGNESSESDVELSGKALKSADRPGGFFCYDEEQQKLKEEISTAIKFDSDADNDSNGLLIYKKPTTSNTESTKIEFSNNELDPWFESNKSLFTEKEKSLLKFLIDKNSADSSEGEEDVQINADVEEAEESDTEFVQNQEQHEAKYNFRFETPGGCEIKTFPRQVNETLRQPDKPSRSEKRREIKAKRNEIELRREEELKRFKKLKKKEILEKIEKIRRTSGIKQLDWSEKDLESDFDPDKHDQMMTDTFNDEYYNTNNDMESENEKPCFSDDSENDTIEPKKDIIKSDYEAILQNSAAEKPIFNPEVETFESYLQRNYNLDFDDIVDNELSNKKPEVVSEKVEKPNFTFRYRECPVNSFGLTYEEILGAPDRELNAWVSLKKASQYRDERDEFYDKRKFDKLSQNRSKKAKILSSLYKDPNEVPIVPPPISRQSSSNSAKMLSDIKFCVEKRKKKKIWRLEDKSKKAKNKTKKGPLMSEVDLSNQRLKAYGITNPNKFRHMYHHKKRSEKRGGKKTEETSS